VPYCVWRKCGPLANEVDAPGATLYDGQMNPTLRLGPSLLIVDHFDNGPDQFDARNSIGVFYRFLAWFLLAVSAGSSVLASDLTISSDWPQFRGSGAAGVSSDQNLPENWNVQTGANVRWKVAIPGLGHASPIVLGDQVFIATAESSAKDSQVRVGLYGDIAPVPTEPAHAWQLLCLSKETGQILWKRTIVERVPQIKRHTKATHANSTPAADKCHVVVFLGSEGLYCYDRSGNILWQKDFGVLDSGYYVVPAAQWGFASSPIIFKNMVIVQCDVQQNSFVAAFDLSNGMELWRTTRKDVPTWCTPTIFEGKTRTELVVNGFKHAGGYDPWTGKELWKLGGGGDIPVPTPVAAHGLIFLSSAHGQQRPLCAIREGATGDITPTSFNEPGDHFAWYLPRSGIYMQTPIVYGDYLYACGDNGLLNCYEARTGKNIYHERLGNGNTGFTASAVAAGGKLYFTSELGDLYVVQSGAEFKLLATNAMGETCMATPAISDGMLIVRTESHVYAIGPPPVQAKNNTQHRPEQNSEPPQHTVVRTCSPRGSRPSAFCCRVAPLGRCHCPNKWRCQRR
jgi:outer membrane protein assembly factor BamB